MRHGEVLELGGDAGGELGGEAAASLAEAGGGVERSLLRRRRLRGELLLVGLGGLEQREPLLRALGVGDHLVGRAPYLRISALSLS